MLQVKMEAMEIRAESAEDMTAAEMAAVPMIETKAGVRWFRAIGRIIAPFPLSNGDGEPKEVRFQSGI